MIRFERSFERSARGEVRARAMEVADAVARGEARARRLVGRLSRYSVARIDSQRMLVVELRHSLLRVIGVCRRESIKFEALSRQSG